MKNINIKTISDITCNNFFRDFNISDDIQINFNHGHIDQFIPEILNTSDKNDFILLHISPYAFNSYSPSKSFQNSVEQIIQSLKSFIKDHNGKVILNNIPFHTNSFSQDDIYEDFNLGYEINNLLVNFARDNQNDCILIDLAGLVTEVGLLNSLSIRNYSIMRLPYTNLVRKKIFEEYKFNLSNYFSPRKKAIFVDADNTLWDGVVGEEGVNGVKIDHEFPGSNYYQFQENLIKLKKSGIILCLVTKNNLSDIEEIFNERDMPLSINDFVEIKANWEPKSKNIEELLISLNIGASSVIFIDDNPFEIDQVKRSNNDLTCVQFNPNNFSNLNNELSKVPNLYAHNLTQEDRVKSESYAQEKERKKNMQKSTSIEDYLSSLDMEINIFYNNKEHIPRISQLTQKTNQFNLTTKRSSVSDIENFMQSGSVYSFSVKDRFGDMGIVGVVIINKENNIDTFLLSCRAFGRHIEKAMLSEALKHNNKYPIFSSYLASSKNKMTEQFYAENSFLEKTNGDDFKTYSMEKSVKYEENFYGEIIWS
jgi:FkbH-like protein